MLCLSLGPSSQVHITHGGLPSQEMKTARTAFLFLHIPIVTDCGDGGEVFCHSQLLPHHLASFKIAQELKEFSFMKGSSEVLFKLGYTFQGK